MFVHQVTQASPYLRELQYDSRSAVIMTVNVALLPDTYGHASGMSALAVTSSLSLNFSLAATIDTHLLKQRHHTETEHLRRPAKDILGFVFTVRGRKPRRLTRHRRVH